MFLSEEQIAKFQKMYKDRFGIEINRKEAFERGLKLVQLVKLIYEPTRKDENPISNKNPKNQGH